MMRVRFKGISTTDWCGNQTGVRIKTVPDAFYTRTTRENPASASAQRMQSPFDRRRSDKKKLTTKRAETRDAYLPDVDRHLVQQHLELVDQCDVHSSVSEPPCQLPRIQQVPSVT
eukprot:374475-Rhodomonas_salina.1